MSDKADIEATKAIPYRSSDSDEGKKELDGLPRYDNKACRTQAWTPLLLRRRVWIPLLLIMVLFGIGLEIALYFSNKNKGWRVVDGRSAESGVMHYVYTLIPTALAMLIAAGWSDTNADILRMQPYVSLARGGSPSHQSLLLDYTRDNQFIVWIHAIRNKHYIVVLSSLLALVTLLFGPFASSLYNIQNTLVVRPDEAATNLATIGLNQDAQFQDLSSFLTAAGFSSASVLFNLQDPPFVWGDYTVAPFQLPTRLSGNGTVTANTTAIKSDAGCENAVYLNMTKKPGGLGYDNFANASNGCSSPWEVDNLSTRQFEAFTSTCPNNGITPDEFRPVVLWFYASDPVLAAAIFCSPSIQLMEVTVTIDIASSNITSVVPIGPLTLSSNFGGASANVTGPPLNGLAYNGVAFNTTNSDPFTLARQNATRMILPAAVMQSAEIAPEGLTNVYTERRFVELSSNIYMTYLKLIARTVYFVPTQIPMAVHVEIFEKRLWMSDLSVHVISVALFIISICGVIVHILHQVARRELRLVLEPGTIASAIYFTAESDMAAMFDGQGNEKDIRTALTGKTFRIDHRTNKITMDGGDSEPAERSPSTSKRADH